MSDEEHRDVVEDHDVDRDHRVDLRSRIELACSRSEVLAHRAVGIAVGLGDPASP